MTRALRFGLRASGQGRAAPVPTGAEGSLDAELTETILARSGMEDGLILCSVGLFSVLRTSRKACRGVCMCCGMVMRHSNACGVSWPPFRSIADTLNRES